MKITFVTSYVSQSGGGVATAIEGASAALVRQSRNVEIVALSDKKWATDKDRWLGAPVRAFPVQTPRTIGYSRSLLDGIFQGKPDILHSHGLWLYPSACVNAWTRKSGRPYIVSPHGMLDSWAASRSRLKKRIAGWLYETQHLRGAGCLHALCEQEAKSIRAFGLTNPICIIPNGVDLPDLSAPAGSPPWAGAIPAHGRVLLFLGRLHEKKNLHGLLKAMAELHGEAPMHGLRDWRLAVAGWDQAGYGAALKAGLGALGLEDRVVFIGPVSGSAKDAALRCADAFILPSLSEGLPMAVLEAWAYSLPVAMTEACNLPQGFKARAAFELMLPGLRSSLQEFLSLDRAGLKSMGERGRALAAEKFAWSEIAAKLAKVYAWMLGGQHRPSTVLD